LQVIAKANDTHYELKDTETKQVPTPRVGPAPGGKAEIPQPQGAGPGERQ